MLTKIWNIIKDVVTSFLLFIWKWIKGIFGWIWNIIKNNWFKIILTLAIVYGIMYFIGYDPLAVIKDKLYKDIKANDTQIEKIQDKIKELENQEKNLQQSIYNVNAKIDYKFDEVSNKIYQYSKEKVDIINNQNNTEANLEYVNMKYGGK